MSESTSGLKPATRTEAEARAECERLVFEIHNGFGSKDPGGDPWPVGYISVNSPRHPIIEVRAMQVLGSAADWKRAGANLILRLRSHDALVKAAESALEFAKMELDLRLPSEDPEYISYAQKAVDDLTAALKIARGE
jgi:hypothetical protein